MAVLVSFAARALAALALVAQAFLPAPAAVAPGLARSSGGSDPLLPLTWAQPKFGADPHPPRINSTVFDAATPGLALASEDGGTARIFRSTDGGRMWRSIPRPEPGYATNGYRLAYGNQQGVFYAYGAGVPHKTMDAGASWTPLPYPATRSGAWVLVSHPVTPTVLFAGTDGGIVRSLDGGQTWDCPNHAASHCGGPTAALSIAIGVDQPNVLYANDTTTTGGAWKSTDLGQTWEMINTGLPEDQGYGRRIRRIVVDPGDANRAFALANVDQKVYRTIDGGAHWSRLAQGIENVFLLDIALSPAQANALYATSSDQLYYCDAAAGGWTPRGPTVPHPWGSALNPALSPDPLNASRFLALYSFDPWLAEPARQNLFLPLLRK